MIPRMSLWTIERLRDEMMICALRCKVKRIVHVAHVDLMPNVALWMRTPNLRPARPAVMPCEVHVADMTRRSSECLGTVAGHTSNLCTATQAVHLVYRPAHIA
jgi:hypothetical protein